MALHIPNHSDEPRFKGWEPRVPRGIPVYDARYDIHCRVARSPAFMRHEEAIGPTPGMRQGSVILGEPPKRAPKNRLPVREPTAAEAHHPGPESTHTLREHVLRAIVAREFALDQLKACLEKISDELGPSATNVQGNPPGEGLAWDVHALLVDYRAATLRVVESTSRWRRARKGPPGHFLWKGFVYNSKILGDTQFLGLGGPSDPFLLRSFGVPRAVGQVATAPSQGPSRAQARVPKSPRQRASGNPLPCARVT